MKSLLPFIILIAGLTPIIASIWYVPARFVRLIDLRHRRTIRVLYALLVVAGMFIMSAAATSSNPLLGVLYVAGGFVFMAHVYLCFALLALHGLHRFP